MTIRVLVVDDERLVRAGFRMILAAETDIEVVAEAGTGREALAAVRQFGPDIVLMDIRMPEMDGLEATRRILAMPAPPPRVIVLTTFDLDEYVYEALRAGACGFLLKDAPEDQLLASIRVAAAGGSMFAPSATRHLIEEFARHAPRSTLPPGLAELTPREREVLELVARGLSNREIAAALVVTEHTAKTHVAHLLAKLGLRDRVQAVVLAYEARVVLPGSEQVGRARRSVVRSAILARLLDDIVEPDGCCTLAVIQEGARSERGHAQPSQWPVRWAGTRRARSGQEVDHGHQHRTRADDE